MNSDAPASRGNATSLENRRRPEPHRPALGKVSASAFKTSAGHAVTTDLSLHDLV